MKDHFDKIFWYIVGCTIIGLTYVFAITFIHIEEKALRFADTSLGFFLGTLITSCLFYLTGGNPNSKKSNMADGTTTADISATITTESKTDEK